VFSYLSLSSKFDKHCSRHLAFKNVLIKLLLLLANKKLIKQEVDPASLWRHRRTEIRRNDTFPEKIRLIPQVFFELWLWTYIHTYIQTDRHTNGSNYSNHLPLRGSG